MACEVKVTGHISFLNALKRIKNNKGKEDFNSILLITGKIKCEPQGSVVLFYWTPGQLLIKLNYISTFYLQVNLGVSGTVLLRQQTINFGDLIFKDFSWSMELILLKQ